MQGKTWNESHELALCELLPFAVLNEKHPGPEAVSKFIEFLNEKRELFSALDSTIQTEILHHISYSALCALLNRNFFDDLDEIHELNATFGSVEEMKQCIDGNASLIASLHANKFELSHSLIAAMLSHSCEEAESAQRTQKIFYLCDLLTTNIKQRMKEVSPEDLEAFLDWIPESSETSVFSLLRAMFFYACSDANRERALQKASLIQKCLEPHLEDWVAEASPAETKWIMAVYKRDPVFYGTEWADCHYSVLRILDGAVLDDDEARCAPKVEMCKAALEGKRSLFLNARNRQNLIEKMNKELEDDTIRILGEMGFFPEPERFSAEPEPANFSPEQAGSFPEPSSRKRLASETTDDGPSVSKEPRLSDK